MTEHWPSHVHGETTTNEDIEGGYILLAYTPRSPWKQVKRTVKAWVGCNWFHSCIALRKDSYNWDYRGYSFLSLAHQ